MRNRIRPRSGEAAGSASLRIHRGIFSLPQLAPVQVQPKVDSEFGKFAQEVERQDLVAIRVRENADKALDRAALVNYPL